MYIDLIRKVRSSLDRDWCSSIVLKKKKFRGECVKNLSSIIMGRNDM